MAEWTKPRSGFTSWGRASRGWKPSHSFDPSPFAGSSPVQLRRTGTMPAGCQQMSPVESAQTWFSEGVAKRLSASRNSGTDLARMVERPPK